jgi:hypothetical protein
VAQPKVDKEGAEKVKEKYDVERALGEQKSQKDLEKAALTDEKLAVRLAKQERKRKALALLDQVESGKAQIVTSQEALKLQVLRKETVKEYLETFLLGLAVILGKRPAADLKFDPEASYERLAGGLNKVAPEFAIQLESGSGYADIAVGIAGVGKQVWDTISGPDIKPKEIEEGKDEKRAGSD